jgi:uncharacterized protein YegP (UPF0339 family)
MAGAISEYPQAEFYKDEAGEYRWRLKARNGRIVADCGEGYSRKADCKAAYFRVFKLLTETTVELVHVENWNA